MHSSKDRPVKCPPLDESGDGTFRVEWPQTKKATFKQLLIELNSESWNSCQALL